MNVRVVAMAVALLSVASLSGCEPPPGYWRHHYDDRVSARSSCYRGSSDVERARCRCRLYGDCRQRQYSQQVPPPSRMRPVPLQPAAPQVDSYRDPRILCDQYVGNPNAWQSCLRDIRRRSR